MSQTVVVIIMTIASAAMSVVFLWAASTPGLSPLWNAKDERGTPWLRYLRGCLIGGLAVVCLLATCAGLFALLASPRN